jgi:hypothetical protein
MRLPRIALLLLVPFFFLQACSRPDDTVIRETITQMKQEAEAGKWNEVLSHISKHYKDKSGNNAFVIMQMIKAYTADVQELQVNIEFMGISVNDREAFVQLKLVVKGKRYGKVYYVVGTEENPEYPKLDMAKEGRKWKITRVDGIHTGQDNPW